ncbi:MAG: ABC transporter ATP-binding protein [Thermoleophilia bacterium]
MEPSVREPIIRTEQLTKNYGPNRGIESVDLEVFPGEVFGFLGPNGAGKTTFIRTVLDFLHPTSGRAMVFGLDSQKDSVSIKARVGNLPGEFTLDERMTGRELIRFFARLRGVEDLSYADELARRLDAELDRPMRRLSRGNKQKIGLVQAMFHRPPLLILDEPSGGLDPLVQEEFLRIVRELRDQGHTIFFSSHILSEVERVCDRVGIIREGRLVTVETISSLLEKRFRRMHVRFAEPVGPEALEGVPGVIEVTANEAGLSLTFGSEVDALLKVLAGHTVVDFEVDRPSLEEIFLTYYGGES